MGERRTKPTRESSPQKLTNKHYQTKTHIHQVPEIQFDFIKQSATQSNHYIRERKIDKTSQVNQIHIILLSTCHNLTV